MRPDVSVMVCSGKRAIVEIRVDNESVRVPYYEILRYLKLLRKSVPAKCKTCKGDGRVGLPKRNPRDLVTCVKCEGTGVTQP